MSALQPKLSVVDKDPPPPPAPRRSQAVKAALVQALKVGVSIALLTLLMMKTDRTALVERIRGADVLLVAGAVLLYVFMLVISIWRWRLLLHAQGHVAPMAH